jgi:PhoH-like ATPase
MKNSKNSRKVFILDTSVLLYDKQSIHSFPDNDVLLPLVVLDELDRFKDKKGVVGENARYINRYLDKLREKGNLHSGIEIENKQTIRVALNGFNKVPVGLDSRLADNQIISLALYLTQELKNPIVMVTKDINFRVKCDSLGIKSEDYMKDKVLLEDNEFYKGYIDVHVSNPEIIDRLYESGVESDEDIINTLCEGIGRKFYENEFVCLKNEQQSFLGKYSKGSINKVMRIDDMDFGLVGVRDRNREQLYALNLLYDDNVPLVSITGLAGTGKTYLTLMTAVAGVYSGKYQRIVITRNVQPVGRDIGFLPGDMNDKMLPWMSPIMDNFRQGLKDKDLTYFNTMRQKGVIEVAPLAFMRGRTFKDTFLIMDESQNSTIHELKTVITRVGENSKIVLLGDVDQIDTPYIDSLSNGLTIVGEKFKNESIAGHVQLKKGERSYLSSIAAKII